MNKLKEALERFGEKNKASMVSATVQSVEGRECTCLVDGVPVHGVRLQATACTGGFLVVPAVGAQVILGLENDTLLRAFVVATSQVERIELSTTGKLSIENEHESLHGLLMRQADIIAALLELLKRFEVTTPAGPGMPNPVVVAELSALLNSDLNSFKQGLNSLLQ